MSAWQTHPKLEITFSSAWWEKNYQLDFSEEAWLDPVVRTERDRQQRRLLFERFGDVGLGEENPVPRPDIEAYGHRFMSALWGCKIQYLPHQAPAAKPLPDALEQMRELQFPNLEASPVTLKAFADARLLKERYGFCRGDINFGGPLNNAVSIFGEEILATCLTDPDLARAVLRKMGEAIIAVCDQVTRRINGFEDSSAKHSGELGNCPVCMVSPQTYNEVVLPVDEWFRQHFEYFGLHHCGIFHPYAQAYRALNPDALEVGWGSNLRLTRKAFPRTPMSLLIQSDCLLGEGLQHLDESIGQMLKDAAPLDRISRIWLADAGVEATDDIVRDLIAVFQRRLEETICPS